MSIESWKKEFLPVSADRVSLEKSGRHVERKWTGLLKKNLKKHGLEKPPWMPRIFDKKANDYLDIDADSCAWCRINKKNIRSMHYCGHCPALKAGLSACDSSDEGESPWHAWAEGNKIRPMLKWIRKVRKLAGI